MKKKLFSFVIAAAMALGIPAAMGTANINIFDEAGISPIVAEASVSTSSIGTTRHSKTSGTVSAYASFDRKASKAICTIQLQEKYNGKWRKATGLTVVTYKKIVYNSYSISTSRKFTLKSGKVYRAKIVFTDFNSTGTHYKTRYTGSF